MKLFIVVSIVFVCGLLGYKYKKKYLNQINSLKELKNYCIFLKDNLYLFKNNIQEINNNYIIMQKNKNAKIYQYELNNAQSLCNYIKILQNNIFDIELNNLINQYFLNLGNSEYDYEINKVDEFISLLEREILITEKDSKEKGDLYFKLSLAIGSVLGILIW